MAIMDMMQGSFTGGEIAPSLYTRVKLEKYLSAVRTMRNFIIHTHGGASNRGGTYYVGTCKDAALAVRLIPFQFSVTQSYVLEFGNLYMRVIKDGGYVETAPDTPYELVTPYTTAELPTLKYTQSADTLYITTPTRNPRKLTREDHDDWSIDLVVFGASISPPADALGWKDSKVITAATQADPVVVTAVGHTIANGTVVDIREVEGMVELNNQQYKVKNVGADTMQLTDLDDVNIDGTGFTAYTGGGKVRPAGVGVANKLVVTAVSPTGEESLASDVVTMGDTETIAWDPVAEAEYYKVYKDEALETGFYGWVADVTEGQYWWKDDSVVPDRDHTPPEARNPFEGGVNYPGVCAFHDQRLVYARLNSAPQTVHGSNISHYDNFNKSHAVRDDEPYEYTLDARQVNEIVWLVSLSNLLVGTTGAEWRMGPGGAGDTITPTSVSNKVQSQWGCADLFPLIVGNTVLFLNYGSRVIRELAYSLADDAYTGAIITIYANHLFENHTITDWCYQRNPYSVIWCIRDDGVLLGLTYLKEHEIWGWHRHDTDGEYESVCTIPDGAGNDDLYVVVKREIGGSDVRYVERFVDRLPETDIEQAFIVDSGLTLDSPVTITGATQADPVVITAVAHGFSNGDTVDIRDTGGMTELDGGRYLVANEATDTFEITDLDGNDIDGTGYTAYVSGGTARKAVTSISGLDHLEGESVVALADGNVVTGLTVASGAITLANAASIIHVGLPYTCDLEPLDFVVSTRAGGSTLSKKRGVKSAVVHLQNTRSMWIGPSSDRLTEIPFRTTEPYGKYTALFTGPYQVALHKGDKRASRVFIRVSDPVPITVTGIEPEINVGA